jgi:DNA-directed RNA polymerase sigma subunit (sigma70/sigma32)
VIANHFSDLRDENKRLLAERENLRRALTDREEDVRLLRAQLQKEKQFKISEDVRHSLADFGVEEKISENLVKQIEKLQIKCASLKQDLQVWKDN